MKKGILILFTVVVTTSLFAQNSSQGILKYNWFNQGWFFDVNAGTRLLGKTSEQANMKPGFTSNTGAGYLFNEKFGVKGRVDYHNFQTTGGTPSTSHSIGVSVEGIANLIQIIGERKARKFSLVLHGGVGVATLFNPKWKQSVIDDPNRELNDGGFNGNNELFHIIVGITPQYHINSILSLNLDVSHFTQFRQYNTYDTFNAEKADGVTGVLGLSLGLTFRLP